MRIVFFGSPPVSLIPLQKVLESGHEIPLVVTQPDRPKGRGREVAASAVKKFAVKNNIPVLQTARIRKNDSAVDMIKEVRPDINIVAAYGQIIPKVIFDLPPYRSLNIHFSLLPKYRGASPVQWALLNGEKTTGVTIFQLNEKMDEGDIVCQEKTVIQPDETAADLERRLAVIGAKLLTETLENIDRIRLSPQDHSLATSAPLIKKQDGEIDWSNESIRIERQTRAFIPWPSSYTYHHGKRIKIIVGTATAKTGRLGRPGEILLINKNGIDVECGQNSVFRIELLQPENKKPMAAYDYSLGARLKEGMRFGKKVSRP